MDNQDQKLSNPPEPTDRSTILAAKKLAVDRWIVSILARFTDPELEYAEINRLFDGYVLAYPGSTFPPLIEKKALDLALAVYPERQDLLGRLDVVERMLEAQWPLYAFRHTATLPVGAPAVVLDGVEAAILAIPNNKSRGQYAVAAFSYYLNAGRPNQYPPALETEAIRYLAGVDAVSGNGAAALRSDMQPWWNLVSNDRARLRAFYSEFEEEFWPLYDGCKDYTLTSIERLYDLYKAVEYVSRASIPGIIIECGVWRGGSMMLAALALKKRGEFRNLFLFDTFQGMPFPGPQHTDLYGDHGSKQWYDGWAKAVRSEVEANLLSTGYPEQFVHVIEGPVEKTLASCQLSEPVALARLDTDWYESTKAELEALWPRLVPGGVLIIDDYGHWRGARQATDEYFADKPTRLVRVDYSCRVVQKAPAGAAAS